jgi:hypothetical protein
MKQKSKHQKPESGDPAANEGVASNLKHKVRHSTEDRMRQRAREGGKRE